MASVFWDSDEGVVMIDYFEVKVCCFITTNAPASSRPAPAHTSAVATAATQDCCFELLNHSLYSPDLAPSDFRVFLSLKDSLRGQTFESNETVIEALNDWFKHPVEKFFIAGVNALGRRCENALPLNGYGMVY